MHRKQDAMKRDEDLMRAIRQREVKLIIRWMFEGNPPSPRIGFCTETELWDFKSQIPAPGRDQQIAWAKIASYVLGFHNNLGGLLIFGIRDTDFTFSGAGPRLDSKIFNDQLRRFLPDTIWVEYQRAFIQPDQKYLGIALIPPRGPRIERFKESAPLSNGKSLFEAGGCAIRQRDSTRIYGKHETDRIVRQLAIPTVGETYAIDEPYFRILSPDYDDFVVREQPCDAVEKALKDPRASITSVIGIGGVGKTALATWSVLRAYDRADFNFIVSITAKDRELSAAGIRGVQPTLTSFETLLDSVLEVLGFPEARAEEVAEREGTVRGLLEQSGGLLYVDNLETVDDSRIIRFLDSLPLGVRAIVTSRRTSVRVSVRPIDLGGLTEEEIDKFVSSLKTRPELTYIHELGKQQRVRIGKACDGIPLAIRWTLSSSKSPDEAIRVAEGITAAGRQGEELLEFCFRRVFDAMSKPEKSVLHVLSLFQRPILTEAVMAGTGLENYVLRGALEDLIDDALVQRLFDNEHNDYAYTLPPVTRSFVYAQVSKQPNLERQIRQAMSDWFEARDVRDADERRVIREIRQGKEGAETALLDLAQAAERRGDIYGAENLYQQALARNPNSWKAARLYGELARHKLGNVGVALTVYERAAANAPLRGPERSRIYREWGMLLKNSGDPQATDLAIEKFETALLENKNDAVAAHALATMLTRKGVHRRAIELLEPLLKHHSLSTRQKTIPILIRAYDGVGELLKAAELRAQLQIDK